MENLAFPEKSLVFYIDVDNTLIDNDRVKVDVNSEINDLIGEERAAHFWEVYEQVRRDMDGINIPETLERIKPEFSDQTLYKRLYRLWMDFPYPEYIFPDVFETLAHLKTFAELYILSDGDASFQLRKIVASGLSRAVDGNLLIYLHKDHHFEDVERMHLATHYIMVEDKPSLLAAAKDYFGNRITTILLRQGKYSLQPAKYAPDLTLNAFGDLRNFSAEQFANGKLEG
jgi:FMN phosphatase YigB (HAD superfamily)